MQDRKRLEEAIADDAKVGGMTDDLDTLFELARSHFVLTGGDFFRNAPPV